MDDATATPSSSGVGAPAMLGGACHTLLAFDIGFQIDLDAAEGLVLEATRPRVVRARRPAPRWFEYTPAPLRLTINAEPVAIGDGATSPNVEMVIYDFGAALVMYTLELPGDLAGMARLGLALYENEAIRADATAHTERILRLIRPAVERPRLHEFVEDYTVFSVRSWEGGRSPSEIVAGDGSLIARAIEAEGAELSPEQVERTLTGKMSYAPTDLAIIDWNAAVLFDAEPEDILAVLRHANVELLELRVLDHELDQILDHADETLAAMVRRRLWPTIQQRGMLGRFASVQTDAAVMFEGVNNAIKLLGNQYLARVYRLAARQFDLPSWQASVQRKLAAAESIYQKMSDAAATRRLETLEVVIIILIAISIVLPFVIAY